MAFDSAADHPRGASDHADRLPHSCSPSSGRDGGSAGSPPSVRVRAFVESGASEKPCIKTGPFTRSKEALAGDGLVVYVYTASGSRWHTSDGHRAHVSAVSHMDVLSLPSRPLRLTTCRAWVMPSSSRGGGRGDSVRLKGSREARSYRGRPTVHTPRISARRRFRYRFVPLLAAQFLCEDLRAATWRLEHFQHFQHFQLA